MRRSLVLLSVALLALAACDSSRPDESADTAPATGATVAPAPDTAVPDTSAPDTVPATDAPATSDGAPSAGATPKPDPSRPYDVFVPSGYDPATPTPLVLLLHGFGASGAIQEGYFQVQPLAEEKGFLYVHPDGTLNQIQRTFWNATTGCCGVASQVDDVGYLLSIVEQVSKDYNVDPKRVYLMGHSNGGFMSYRMACEAAGTFAAIASLAGATYVDPSQCAPSEPVSVLQVHGTADDTIAYDGGKLPFMADAFPGARDTVSMWAQYDGCGATATPLDGGFDFEQSIPGTETGAESFDGCPPGIAVELWTIEGGTHIPDIVTPTVPYPLTAAMVDFLLAHPKP